MYVLQYTAALYSIILKHVFVSWVKSDTFDTVNIVYNIIGLDY